MEWWIPMMPLEGNLSDGTIRTRMPHFDEWAGICACALEDGFAEPSGSSTWSALFSDLPNNVYREAWARRSRILGFEDIYGAWDDECHVKEASRAALMSHILYWRDGRWDWGCRESPDRPTEDDRRWAQSIPCVDVGRTRSRDYTSFSVACRRLLMLQMGADQDEQFTPQPVDEHELLAYLPDYIDALVRARDMALSSSDRCRNIVHQDYVDFMKKYPWKAEHLRRIAKSPMATLFMAAKTQSGGKAAPEAITALHSACPV